MIMMMETYVEEVWMFKVQKGVWFSDFVKLVGKNQSKNLQAFESLGNGKFKEKLSAVCSLFWQSWHCCHRANNAIATIRITNLYKIGKIEINNNNANYFLTNKINN